MSQAESQSSSVVVTNSRGIRVDAYPHDPVGYARDVLGIELWSMQQKIARSVLTPPYRTLVKSAHSVGKTHLAAVLVNWFYDSFNPGVTITTAPIKRDVVDLLWAQIRSQRARAGLGDLLPKAPEMASSVDHYAKGYTAAKGESFQGRHPERGLFLFDEACGVDPMYWITTATMWKPRPFMFWLAICNPTDTTSRAYLEDTSSTAAWHRFEVSALEHPNIIAQLQGREPPIPAAVTMDQVEVWIADWCEPIPAEQATATDFEWPPSAITGKPGRWYRPGPIFEARGLGRWPSAGTYGIWSDLLWGAVELLVLPIPPDAVPEIGCDVARFGDDWTSIHVRAGGTSLQHESFNKRDTSHTIGRLKQLAHEWAERAGEWCKQTINPKTVPLKVDDDGVGGGVVDGLREAGYRVIPINAGSKPHKPSDYPRRRDELWFVVADRAKRGELSLARLDALVRQKIKQQALAPQYWLDSQGRRVVEPKRETKDKIGRSPDDMDAVNLAYADGFGLGVPSGVDTPRRNMTPHAQQEQPQRSERQESERQHYQPRPERRQWGLHRRS